METLNKLMLLIGVLGVGLISKYIFVGSKSGFKSIGDLSIDDINKIREDESTPIVQYFWGKNPMNIRGTIDDNTLWVGEEGGDRNEGNYLHFTHPKFSFRAAYKILESYQRRGVVTLNDILHTYAPVSDNNHTQNYIDYVAQKSGIDSGDVVKDNQRYLIFAYMSDFETGEHGRYTPELVNDFLGEFGYGN